MTPHARFFRKIALSTMVIGASGCGDPYATDLPPLAVEPGGPIGAAQASTEDPIVDSVDPSSAPQDTTLVVEVLGHDFDPGSTVQLELDGAPSPHVTTNGTQFINKRRLRAEITIAADAPVDLYDVAVTTSKGRKGIGLEMFAVTRKGNPNEPIATVGFADPEDDADPLRRYFSDGGGAYIDQVDDVLADVAGQFIFRPNEGSAPGSPTQLRRVCLRFTAGQEVTGAGIPADLADDLDATGRVCPHGDFRTVWHSNADLGFQAMASGDWIRAEARYIWTDGENNQFKLEFFCRDDRGGDDGVTACGHLLDVTLFAETATSRTWRITFNPAAVATLSRNFVRGKANPFEPLAAFHLPFEMTVRLDE